MGTAVTPSPFGISVVESPNGMPVEISANGGGMLVRYVPAEMGDATRVTTLGGFPGYTPRPDGTLPTGRQSYVAAVPGVGATWAAVYGTERLLVSYTGALIRSAGGVDMGGGSKGGIRATDVAVARGTNEAVNIQTIYDQSGNARNLVQATDISQPRVHDAVVTGGRCPLLFDGHRTQNARVASTTANLGLSRQDYTLFLLIDPTCSLNAQAYFAFNDSGTPNTSTLNDLQEPNNGGGDPGGFDSGKYTMVNGGFGGGFALSGKWVPAIPQVLVIRGTATETSFFILGQKTTAAAAAAGTLNQFNLGSLPSAGGYSSNWRSDGALLVGKALTDAEIAARTAELNARMGYQTTFDQMVVLVGTSRTAGGSSTLTRNKLWYQRSLYNKRTLVYNFGVDGATVQEAYGVRASRELAVYRPDLPVAYVFDDPGINDLGAVRGVSSVPATIYTALTNFNTAIKALGSNVKTVCETIIPQNSTAYAQTSAQVETGRQTLNALIEANSAGFDAIAMTARDPAFTSPPQAGNTDYSPDLLHPYAPGYQKAAPYSPARVNKVLP